MGDIRVLPEQIANKIAAGEVIERPASIVKELMENALDAGANSITVEVESGGRRLIRISDDGRGMDPDDARLAFQRHATSKIGALEDLEQIRSFGFRGEALAAIAAVSRCRLISRTADSVSGTEVVIEGGVLKGVQEHPCRPGTIIEVRDLFFNTPARRKFLKAESTEMGHVMDVLSRAALSSPQVRFLFRADDRILLELLPTARLLPRLEALLGKEATDSFLELQAEREGIRLSGLLGKPALTRGNRSQIQLFINSRWVRALPFSYALQAGYQGLLMEGRCPVAVLFIELDFQRVDVNVHPAKQEVRVSNEAEVSHFIQQAVRDCLARSGELAPRLNLVSPPGSVRDYPLRTAGPSPAAWSVFDQPTVLTQTVPAEAMPEPIAIQEKIRVTRVLGQLHRTFLVAETEEGFVLVDQHAAHERVMFEALLKNLKSDQPQRQMLFLEEALEIPVRQKEPFQNALPFLTRLGFELESFGEQAWVIRACPAALGEINPNQLIQTFLDQVEEGKIRTSLEEAHEAVAALCACKKKSVKASDPLEPRAIRVLLEQLARCENPFTCPHGRPVFFTQTVDQLEKQFKRTG